MIDLRVALRPLTRRFLPETDQTWSTPFPPKSLAASKFAVIITLFTTLGNDKRPRNHTGGMGVVAYTTTESDGHLTVNVSRQYVLVLTILGS